MRTSYVQLIKHIVKFIAAVSVAIYSVAYVYALMLKSDAKNFELCGEQCRLKSRRELTYWNQVGFITQHLK